MVRGLFLWSCSRQPRGLLNSIHSLHRGFLGVDGLAFAFASGSLWGIEGLSERMSSDVPVDCLSGVRGLAKRPSSRIKGFSKGLYWSVNCLRKASSLCDNLAKNRERGRDI